MLTSIIGLPKDFVREGVKKTLFQYLRHSLSTPPNSADIEEKLTFFFLGGGEVYADSIGFYGYLQ